MPASVWKLLASACRRRVSLCGAVAEHGHRRQHRRDDGHAGGDALVERVVHSVLGVLGLFQMMLGSVGHRRFPKGMRTAMGRRPPVGPPGARRIVVAGRPAATRPAYPDRHRPRLSQRTVPRPPVDATRCRADARRGKAVRQWTPITHRRKPPRPSLTRCPTAPAGRGSGCSVVRRRSGRRSKCWRVRTGYLRPDPARRPTTGFDLAGGRPKNSPSAAGPAEELRGPRGTFDRTGCCDRRIALAAAALTGCLPEENPREGDQPRDGDAAAEAVQDRAPVRRTRRRRRRRKPSPKRQLSSPTALPCTIRRPSGRPGSAACGCRPTCGAGSASGCTSTRPWRGRRVRCSAST